MSGASILETLIRELERLPGVGAKTAERLAYNLLKVPPPVAIALADAIRLLKEGVKECRRCHNIAEGELCVICADEARNQKVLCVVEQPKDLHAVEQSGCYRGLYHVLGGNFSPLEDRGADSLTIDHLVQRVQEEGVEEVVIATNPDFEGDGTAMVVMEGLASTGLFHQKSVPGQAFSLRI